MATINQPRSHRGNPLRRTHHYVAMPARNGVRIRITRPKHVPRERVIDRALWPALRQMTDREFEDTCCLELGIGLFAS